MKEEIVTGELLQKYGFIKNPDGQKYRKKFYGSVVRIDLDTNMIYVTRPDKYGAQIKGDLYISVKTHSDNCMYVSDIKKALSFYDIEELWTIEEPERKPKAKSKEEKVTIELLHKYGFRSYIPNRYEKKFKDIEVVIIFGTNQINICQRDKKHPGENVGHLTSRTNRFPDNYMYMSDIKKALSIFGFDEEWELKKYKRKSKTKAELEEELHKLKEELHKYKERLKRYEKR